MVDSQAIAALRQYETVVQATSTKHGSDDLSRHRFIGSSGSGSLGH